MSALVEIQLQQPQHENHGFQQGHPRYGGRQKGSRNRIGGDLRQMIMDAAAQTGFIQVNDKGERIAGEGGCTGFLRWLYLNEPKTAAALLARVMKPTGLLPS